MAHLIRPLFVALVATIGDFIWFEYGIRHTTTTGIVHGAVMLMSVGLVLGVRAGWIIHGALGGIVAGVAGALAFYAVYRPLGYVGALIAAWMLLWIVLAGVNAWLNGTHRVLRDWLTRGAIAAVSSAVTFYLVSGIWTDRAPVDGRNYFWHLAAWTVAFAPGIVALTLSSQTSKQN